MKARTLIAAAAAAALFAVLALAACGSSDHRAASPGASATSVPQAPRLFSYTLADGQLGYHATDDPRFNPSRSAGVIAVPGNGPGPFPIAVILHGNYLNCPSAGEIKRYLSAEAVRFRSSFWCADTTTHPTLTGPDYVRWELGFSYLAQELAQHGIAAVAVDVQSAETGWGHENREQRYDTLVQSTLTFLGDLNSGNTLGTGLPGLPNQFDLSRIALIGHSRGADHIQNLSWSLPHVIAQVSLEPPTAFEIQNGSGKPSIPQLNVRGECDEDVGSQAGLTTLEQHAAEGGSVSIDVSLAGVTHAGLNSGLNTADIACPGYPNGGNPQTQPEVAQVVAAFLSQTLSHTTAYQIPQLPGFTMTVKNYGHGGPSVSLVPSTATTYTDPRDIPTFTSTQGVLPPLPNGYTITNKEQWAAG